MIIWNWFLDSAWVYIKLFLYNLIKLLYIYNCSSSSSSCYCIVKRFKEKNWGLRSYSEFQWNCGLLEPLFLFVRFWNNPKGALLHIFLGAHKSMILQFSSNIPRSYKTSVFELLTCKLRVRWAVILGSVFSFFNTCFKVLERLKILPKITTKRTLSDFSTLQAIFQFFESVF